MSLQLHLVNQLSPRPPSVFTTINTNIHDPLINGIKLTYLYFRWQRSRVATMFISLRGIMLWRLDLDETNFDCQNSRLVCSAMDVTKFAYFYVFISLFALKYNQVGEFLRLNAFYFILFVVYRSSFLISCHWGIFWSDRFQLSWKYWYGTTLDYRAKKLEKIFWEKLHQYLSNSMIVYSSISNFQIHCKLVNQGQQILRYKPFFKQTYINHLSSYVFQKHPGIQNTLKLLKHKLKSSPLIS